MKDEVIKINKELNAKIHNRFDIEVYDTATKTVRQRAQALNVICKGMWGSNGPPHLAYRFTLEIGNGSGTPAVTDTALFNRIGARQRTDTGATGPVADYSHYKTDKYVSYQSQYVFNEQEYVNSSITEVGLTTGVLCTHAMITDMNGNPITIHKGSTDILTIYATLYIHYSMGFDWGIAVYCNMPIGLDSSDVAYYSGIGGALYLSKSEVNRQRASTNTGVTFHWDTQRVTANELNGDSGVVIAASGGYWFDLRQNYRIENESVGTGDGVNRNFSVKFNFPTNISVKVDGHIVTNFVGLCAPKHEYIGQYFWIIFKESTETEIIPYASNISSGVYDFVYYMPFYNTGLFDFTPMATSNIQTGMHLWCSNDLETWVDLGSVTKNTALVTPVEYRKYRYWKTTGTSAQELYGQLNNSAYWRIRSDSGYNIAIMFDTPPAAGAVITADYTTQCLPKDSNHVYDFSVTTVWGAYTGDEA